MKTKILRLLVFSLVLSFSSCSDFLDVTPHDSLNSNNAMETIEDYNNVMLSCYESIRGANFTDFNTIIPDVMSDNLLICSEGRQTWSEFGQFKFNPSTYGTAGLWLTSYNAILSANEIITRIESGYSFSSEDENKEGQAIYAEALAFRGYMHFMLVRYYGINYKSAKEDDLGVPYKVTTDAAEKPARETVWAVYDKAIADLVKARSILKDFDPNSKENNRIRLKAVDAILTKVYFTKGDFVKAKESALAVLGGTELSDEHGKDVVSFDEYTKMWNTSMKNISEVIWRIAILQTNTQTLGNVYGQGEVSNHKPEYVVSYSFFQKFDADFDIRYSNIKEVSLSGKKYNAIWKYRGRTGESTGKVDMPLIRTSEIVLTLAEILFEENDLLNARKYLDFVRNKRYYVDEFDNNVPTISDGELGEAIALERRLELAFEGDRFFELKRLGLDVNRDDKGDESDGSGVEAVVKFVPKTSPYFLIAIPLDEINANSNIVQNTY